MKNKIGVQVLLPEVNSTWGVIVHPQSANAYRHIINFKNETDKLSFLAKELFPSSANYDIMNELDKQPNQSIIYKTAARAEIIINPDDYPTMTLHELLSKDFCIVKIDNELKYYTLSGEMKGLQIKYSAELDVFMTYDIKNLFNDNEVNIQQAHMNRLEGITKYINGDNMDSINATTTVSDAEVLDTALLETEKTLYDWEDKDIALQNGKQVPATGGGQFAKWDKPYKNFKNGTDSGSLYFSVSKKAKIHSTYVSEWEKINYVPLVVPLKALNISTRALTNNINIRNHGDKTWTTHKGMFFSWDPDFFAAIQLEPTILIDNTQRISNVSVIKNSAGTGWEWTLAKRIDIEIIKTHPTYGNLKFATIEFTGGSGDTINGIGLVQTDGNMGNWSLLSMALIVNDPFTIPDFATPYTLEENNEKARTLLKPKKPEVKSFMHNTVIINNKATYDPNITKNTKHDNYIREIRQEFPPFKKRYVQTITGKEFYINPIHKSEDFYATTSYSPSTLTDTYQLVKNNKNTKDTHDLWNKTTFDDKLAYALLGTHDSWKDYLATSSATRDQTLSNLRYSEHVSKVNTGMGIVKSAGMGAVGGASMGGPIGAVLGGITGAFTSAVSGGMAVHQARNAIKLQQAAYTDLQNAPLKIGGTTGDWVKDSRKFNGSIIGYSKRLPEIIEMPLRRLFYYHGQNLNGRLDNINKYLETRAWFNYIQADGVFENIKGKISPDIKQLIDTSLSNGITIWHYDPTDWKGIKNYEYENIEI